jgi:hypothetical protein
MNVKDVTAEIDSLHTVRTGLTPEYFLPISSSDASFNKVLKRGTVPLFQAGLTCRLSLLSDLLPRAVHV